MRVLLDTNLVLHAAFDPCSVAAHTISCVLQASGEILLADTVVAEAQEVLDEKTRLLDLSPELKTILEEWLCYPDFKHVESPRPPYSLAQVKEHDRHVAAAAQAHEAVLVTGDTPLIAQCRNSSIDATFPWSVILQTGADPSYTAEILRIAGLTKEKGSIFARTYPGGWRQQRNIGKFTVVAIENVGTLRYDSTAGCWEFESVHGNTVCAPFLFNDTQAAIIGLNYEQIAGRLAVTLRSASQEGKQATPQSRSDWRTLSAEPASLTIGHSRGTCYWNGHIRHLVLSPTKISPKLWNDIVALGGDAAPDPLSSDVLERCLVEISNEFRRC